MTESDSSDIWCVSGEDEEEEVASGINRRNVEQETCGPQFAWESILQSSIFLIHIMMGLQYPKAITLYLDDSDIYHKFIIW